MSFLSNMNLDNVDATSDDWSIPNGTYPCVITGSKINEKNGVNTWQITYQIDRDVEEVGGRSTSEFFSLDPNLPATRKAWLKRRLISLGLTDEDIATMDPGDILGIEGFVTVKNKSVGDKTYTNVTKFVLGDDSEAVDNFLSNF